MGMSTPFVTYNGTLNFNPLVEDVGNFSIKILLTDQNSFCPKTTIYNL